MSFIRNTYQTAKLTARLSSQISKIAKEMGDERNLAALNSDEDMREYALEIYGKLSSDLRLSIASDNFVAMIIQSKKKALKKSSVKKKINQANKKAITK